MASILLIEDSEGQRAEVRAALEASGLFDEVLEAGDGIQGLKQLVSNAPDLVLCDLEMPGLDGEKLLRMSQSIDGVGRGVPFIVLTAVTDPVRRARLLEKGASDAITKPFHAPDLIARLGLHLELLRTQRELIEKNAELQRLSRTDPLTGIANRRALDERLEIEFKRAMRYRTAFAVAIGDLDHFKRVNDAHGHAAGDRVLVAVADALEGVVRETDCGGRYGGEEFMAVLGHNAAAGASIFAERWRGAVEAVSVELEAGGSVEPTVSIGVAAWTPAGRSAEELVERADAALYRAKQAGRNRVVVDADEAGD